MRAKALRKIAVEWSPPFALPERVNAHHGFHQPVISASGRT